MDDHDALKLQLNNLLLSEVTSTDKVIGRGAYGRVIEVYVYGTLCAAKEIHPALVENVSAQESEAIRRSFCEECVKASRIHHPNIVQMLGIYYPTPLAKLPWLVMELMQTSLKGFLEKYEQGKVPLHFKLSMLVDIAQGLEFLHGRDIIHRDLSSNNVLLTKNLIAKIADLGVAKVVQENKMKTHTQAPGTTHFMPPEALKSKPHYGKPVDVFSLACVALQVISHQWPEPKDLLPEDTMTALTEMQRRDEYITFCTQPALKKLVESCLHNKPGQRPEISTVCAKLKELKITIEKQVPFAADSNFELFDVVRETNIQKQKLSAANKELTAQLKEAIQVKDQQVQQKDQQIWERDKQIQEKDKQLREKDKQLQEKDKQLQEKDQEIKELQMVNTYSTSQHHEEKFSSKLPLGLLPPYIGGNDKFGLVAQHIVPSSYDDDDDNQLIKESTQLIYRDPPESKPRPDPIVYSGGYRPPDWLLPTTLPSDPAVVSPNRDDKFINTHVQVSREGQHQLVDPRGSLIESGYMNTQRPNMTPAAVLPDDPPKAGGLHSLPSVTVSTSGNANQFRSSPRVYKRQASIPNDTSLSGGSERMAGIPTGTTTNSNKLAVSDNNAVLIAPAVPITDQPTPEVSQAPPDSKYGRTNLNAMKNRLQQKKEVTQSVVQTGGAGPHSRATSNYANAEIPYQGVSDSTNKPVARKPDLASLRSRMEKSKEVREKAVVASSASTHPDYCNMSEASSYVSENPVTIKNPHDKKPVANPRKMTPANLPSNDTHSASSASLAKKSYQLWQCAHCQTVNEVHHTSCEHCKLPHGKMAGGSYFCEFCQMMIFIPLWREDFKDTCCPRCKQVYETPL